MTVDGAGAGRRVRRRHAPWIAIACAAVVVVPIAARAQTVETEFLRVTLDAVWGPRTAPGYLPVRFDIQNLGDARVIEIVGQGTRTSRISRTIQSGTTSVRQSIRLARGDRVRLTAPVPVFADSENYYFEIRERGRSLERFNFIGLQSRHAAAVAGVLIVADSSSEAGRQAGRWPRSGTLVTSARGTPTRIGTTTPDFMLDPERVPSNWIGFTSLRAVVVGAAEWELLQDGQKTALLTWTSAGGDLIVVDGDPNLLPALGSPAAAGDRRPRAHFFGRVHFPTRAAIDASLSSVLVEAQKVQDPNWALPANSAADWGIIADRGFRLPIPGIEGVPARTYLGILVLFSILIGPINYWWLRRRRRQALMVLTAPIIAAVFIVLLAGYALVGEGFGVYGRAVTFTMLDQVRKQAVTRATMSLYAAGMAPSGGLRFPRDTAVFPIGPDGTGARGRIGLNLTDVQQFSEGVVQARSPTNLEVINVRSARERLSFSREGGGPAVVNGLDATVVAMIYRDGADAFSLPAPLAPGARAVLGAGSNPGITVPHGLPLSARFFHLLQHQPEGSYLAVLDRSPFLESGVPELVERGSFHLVLGWPDGQR
jgi:hypothetical protein